MVTLTSPQSQTDQDQQHEAGTSSDQIQLRNKQVLQKTNSIIDVTPKTSNGLGHTQSSAAHNNNLTVQNREGATTNHQNHKKNSVDCIEILDDDAEVVVEEEDDDDVRVIEEPLPKRSRTDTPQSGTKRQERTTTSPVPEDPKTSKESTPIKPVESSSTGDKTKTSSESVAQPQLTTYSALLDRLEAYVKTAIEKGENLDRKLLDSLLGAINIQVQKEPYSVRKLILEKQLMLPNTISIPPSQIVDMVIEHDPEHQLSRVITRLFGEERPKLTDNERRERQILKALHPAPSMTRTLLEIGQDLVQECTYYDIVHARNLPEMPKNMETYKQVAAQLKPVWEALKAKNSPHKMKVLNCHVCGFKTDSRTVMSEHKQTLHFIGRRYQCTYCPEFDTNEYRITKHIIEKHSVKPLPPESQTSVSAPCPICEEDFHYKVQRDHHLKMCRRDVNKLRTVQAGRAPEHINAVNRWLWDKPPVEPSIINQQQEAQQRQQQQLRQQQQQQQLLLQQRKIQQQQAAAAAFALKAAKTTSVVIQQPQQQRIGATGSSLMMGMRQKAGANLLAGALATRIGQQQATAAKSLTAQQPQQQQQRLNLTSLAAGVGTSKQPSVGEILRMAQEKKGGGQIKFTPNLINAAMQAQLLKFHQNQQLQQKSQQILSAATAAANRNANAVVSAGTTTASTSGTTIFRAQQQRGPRPAGNPKIPLPPVLERQQPPPQQQLQCEICDDQMPTKESYLAHLQTKHNQMHGKKAADIGQGAPLACSRCRERFWTYEGLERHLVMSHGLVTSDLLAKAQRKVDSGRCKLCSKQYAFNLLQHLVNDHSVKLCSAEIMYSCDVCSFKCSSYKKLETHLAETHPKKS